MKISGAAVVAVALSHTAAAYWSPLTSSKRIANDISRGLGLSPREGDDKTCEYIIIESSDTCESIAKDRCGDGVKLSDFIKWNGDGDDKFYDNLLVDDPICCSSGKVPDLRPQPDDDGFCKVHELKEGELCDDVAKKYHLDPDDIEDLNKGKTWGWTGCRRLQKGMRFCVSKGDPPIPTPDPKAICGPTIEGTERPTNGTKIKYLN